jgi:hypothetical protein
MDGDLGGDGDFEMLELKLSAYANLPIPTSLKCNK